ncbi:hypothetical protein [Acinetobacter pollinis]|uniref:hypothetical protein n=1 Tax=Acinetobacter pollinis TaxID=2605270 RepID=UPI0018A292A6|nr:hypothetical protein [Acinetobacter pollinis]MBF7691709.1 hypothetical protein [Acinetobacter pollinis]MBF7699284.1 hypothetical protein [Acinetobacter pollinis]
MTAYLCTSFTDTGVCKSWVEYAPQYILPPLTLQEATFLGIMFWTVLLVAWGITSIKNAYLSDKD